MTFKNESTIKITNIHSLILLPSFLHVCVKILLNYNIVFQTPFFVEFFISGSDKNFEFFDYEENDDRNKFNNVKELKIWIVIQVKSEFEKESKDFVKTKDISKEIKLEAGKIQVFRHVMTSDNRFNNVLVGLNDKKEIKSMLSIDEERFFEKAKHNAKTLPVNEWYLKEMKRVLSLENCKRFIYANKDEMITFLDEIKQKCLNEAKKYGFDLLEENIKYLKMALQSIDEK